MTRQEELNEAWCKYMGKCSTEIMQALAFALRWCDEHPNWISVEDELPKKDGKYLFYDEILGVQASIYYDGCTLTNSVTHWMALPQPPAKLSSLERIGKNEL